MNKYWGHFKMITKHKYYVFKACLVAGIPVRGLVHDNSKYSRKEFFEYAKYYNGKGSPVNQCKKEKGYCEGWQHHKGHNPHHWHYWVDNIAEEGGVGLIIPYKYAVEMMCDWIGAGKLYEKENWDYNRPYDWFQTQTLDRAKIHPAIVEFIDYVFLEIKDDKSFEPLKKHHTKIVYNYFIRLYKNNNGCSK